MALSTFFKIHSTRQLKELYLFSVFFSLAQSLLFIFEPVFFYQQGFPLFIIALYYAVHYSLYVVLLPWGGKFVARFGVERSLALSTPIFMFYFVTLALLPTRPSLLWGALILLTLHKIFYWPAYYVDFAQFSDSRNRGTELSWMNVVISGIGVVGPLVGGVVASLFGFPILFGGAAIVVLISSIPLLRTVEENHTHSFEYASPWRIIAEPKHRGMVLAMSGKGEDLINLVFWPILMFIVLGSPTWLGVATTIATVVMLAWGFVIGEWIDEGRGRTVLRWHVLVLSVINFLKPFMLSPFRLVAFNILSLTAFHGLNTPMLDRLYVEGNRAGIVGYSVAFEMVLALAKAITGLLLVAVFFWFAPLPAFIITFSLAALLTWMYAFL